MNEIKLMTLDPGHFHAALVQKEMYPGVAKRVHVYAPLGADLVGHLTRVAGFNSRADGPTDWELEVHAGGDYRDRMLREKPGNVVVLSGRNRAKIDHIQAAVNAGLNVLADKPWVIDAEDLPKLEAVLERAEKKKLVAYDIMTERYEITSILQRELVSDATVFGTAVPGTAEDPGVFMESKHYLMKMVAGNPLRRPAWFFDVLQQGEGLTDVGTHLVDLVTWILFPGQPIDHIKEVMVLSGKRWPTEMSRDDFQKVTGEANFPEYLAPVVHGSRLDYFCNTLASYTVRGVHAKLNVLWDLEATDGSGDTHLAVFRGTRARVEVRQGAEQNYRPELYVVPNDASDAIRAALNGRIAQLQGRFPGVAVSDNGREFRLTIPDRYRIGHEAHFAQVTNQFLMYLQEPTSVPRWERPNMLAKYFVTTEGVRMAQK
jgi:predicted dehydrogenase